jgi:hypothetical protein
LEYNIILQEVAAEAATAPHLETEDQAVAAVVVEAAPTVLEV